jgi:hypothetical protein
MTFSEHLLGFPENDYSVPYRTSLIQRNKRAEDQLFHSTTVRT